MLTLDTLKNFGVDADDGLARCMNNEQFYFRLIKKALEDENFDKLANAVKANDKTEAFEAAHALKGTTGNLSLTPIYKCVSEMTELLRSKADADYNSYLDNLFALRKELLLLAD